MAYRLVNGKVIKTRNLQEEANQRATWNMKAPRKINIFCRETRVDCHAIFVVCEANIENLSCSFCCNNS
ncbi:hypothetical protein LR48_Vigan06g041600 [Vigna angularis]|uniref:Uncharacterized protein n=1 Tax=Phaseolus angularis TaxID=3914 RepID=A0A0L9UQE2_PHAAN|nr:hypothetical protein LR48_Vigan06g041600 [Vigna angularis]